MIDLIYSRKGFLIILSVTLVLRVLFEINFPKLISDHSIQIEAAKNYTQNGQMGSAWVEASDLSATHSAPLKMWPLGFSFFVVLFNVFTRNFIYSAICFQCIGVILFILGCVKLLRYFRVEWHYINLFLLLYAFNPTPFAYLGSTDLFTVGLFMWIVYFTLIEMNEQKVNYLNVVFICFLVFLTAVIRFACIPNMVIIPFAFFLAWFVKRKKILFLKSVLIFTLTFAMIFIFYKVFPFDSTRTGFLENLKNGNLYFSLLKWFDPFTFKGFFFSRPIEFRLPHNTIVIAIYMIGSMLFAIFFLGFILNSFVPGLRIKKWLAYVRANEDINDHFMMIFISAFLVIVGFVTMQTLTTPPESNSFGPSWMPPMWTFVYCTRYFIYLMALLMVMYFIKYEHGRTYGKLMTYGFYRICLAWGILTFLYNTYQFYSPNGNGAGSSWTNEQSSIETFKQINRLPEGNLMVYCHYSNKRKEGLITSFSKAYPTDDYDRIILNDFRTSRPVTLLLSMPKDLSTEELKFLEQHPHKKLADLTKEQLIQFELK